MKLLCFGARRFWWSSHAPNLEGEAAVDVEDEAVDCLVAWVHAEARDEPDDRRPGVFRKTLKHLKWLAGKQGTRTIVLHSFAHLGGENADAEWTRAFLAELRERLEATDFTVQQTPYGHFCTWSLDVRGESLAKVWKEI